MRIDGINNMNGIMQPIGGGQGADPQSKSIQNQIKAKQEELQKLSQDQSKSLEEKMKKRQELQQEIAALENQLRQHQLEQRKEQQNQKNSMDDMLGGTRQTPAEAAKAGGAAKQGMGAASMQAMISADSSLKMAGVKSGIATELKGAAGILESEIKQDKVFGVNTEKKEADLAKITENKEKVTASQISDLAKANEIMSEAAKADAAEKDTATKKDDKDKKDNKDNKEGKEETASVLSETGASETVSGDTKASVDSYVPVDVRL